MTEDDVLSVLSAPELEAYKVAAISLGQEVLTQIIVAATNQARGYIGDNPANTLAAGNTLPERCIRPALHMLRPDMLTRLDLIVSDDRRSAAKDAIRFFERVADGKVQIEQPDGAVDTSGGVSTIETVKSVDREWTRKKQSGL